MSFRACVFAVALAALHLLPAETAQAREPAVTDRTAGHPHVAGASISLPEGCSLGVRWAADELKQSLPPDGVPIACELAPDMPPGAEGYLIRGRGDEVTIAARAQAGLMYGLLEARDRVRDGLDLSSRFTIEGSPKMRWRAVSKDLHMYLGIPLYDDQWSGYEHNDHSTDWWFHDRRMWDEELRRFASARLNAIVFVHPHPFPAFLDYGKRYPEAAWLAPEELSAKRDALRWLIREAAQYGITIHFLTWNIWLPRGFARAHGISQEGVDSPLTREFTRWSIAEMYRTYPGLGGLVTQAAEQPPGCVDFVGEAVVAGLREVRPRPTFFFWSWCSYPEQAKGVVDAYDGPSYVMHYLQYEQFFADRADPRIGRYSRALGGKEMVALGGPKGAHSYLFWGDPQTAHDVMRDLYVNDNGRGIMLEGVTLPDQFLALRAFGKYAWDPTRPYDDREWQRFLARRYGYADAAAAKPLLDAMKSASRVIMEQMRLTHSQTGAFMPQMGMPLVQMLEMPSISTYIFENVQTVGPDGYLRPNMGLCWPNPEWGEPLAPIRYYALSGRERAAWLRERSRLGYAPGRIAEAHASAGDLEAFASGLDGLGYRIEADVARVAPAREGSAELARILEFLKMQAALAHHFAAKDRTALAWEQYRIYGKRADARDAEHDLAESVKFWDRYAAIADRLHPGGAWCTVSAINYPPPWSQMDLWNGYVPAKTTFDERGRMWERELDFVRDELARDPHDRISLPLRDDLVAPRPDGELAALLDFEEPDGRIRLADEPGLKVEITRDPAIVISGRASLLADTRASDREWNEVLATLPQQIPLQANAAYQVMVKYRIIDGGDGTYRAPFGMALRTAAGGVDNDVGDSRMWSGPVGKVRQRVLFARLRDYGDYHLFLTIRGRAAIAVDDVRIEKLP